MKTAKHPKFISRHLLSGGLLMVSSVLSHGSEADVKPETGNEFVVSSDFDRPPYEFLDEKGNPAGLDVDLMKAVARSSGLTVTFQKPGPAGAYAPDVSLAASFVKDSVRQSEQEIWQYIAPHSTRDHAVFVREDALYRNLKDLSGRDVIVANGSHAREWLSRHGYRDHLISVDSLAGGLALLSKGNYEALVCDRFEGLQALKSSGLKNVHALDDNVIPVETGFALFRQDAELAKSLEAGMRVVKKTGEYSKIQNRWLDGLSVENTEVKLGAAYSYALWVLIPALIFLGSACVSFFTVRKRAQARILELERALETAHERCHTLELEHARQRYVINQLSAVSLVDQLAGVSGSREHALY